MTHGTFLLSKNHGSIIPRSAFAVGSNVEAVALIVAPPSILNAPASSMGEADHPRTITRLGFVDTSYQRGDFMLITATVEDADMPWGLNDDKYRPIDWDDIITWA